MNHNSKDPKQPQNEQLKKLERIEQLILDLHSKIINLENTFKSVSSGKKIKNNKPQPWKWE